MMANHRRWLCACGWSNLVSNATCVSCKAPSPIVSKRDRVLRAVVQEADATTLTPAPTSAHEKLRGIGVVVAPRTIKAHKPKHVRRNAGYGDNAPYYETLRDARMPVRTPRLSTVSSNVPAPIVQGAAGSYADRFARFGATNGGNPDA